jgi:hypothetical protein
MTYPPIGPVIFDDIPCPWSGPTKYLSPVLQGDCNTLDFEIRQLIPIQHKSIHVIRLLDVDGIRNIESGENKGVC